MTNATRSLSLIINAGGQSRRMGRPKALLPVPPAGDPLLHHLVARLAGLGHDCLIVVANDPAVAEEGRLPATTSWTPDGYPDTGVLGGIATGLRLCPDWAVMLACDLPLVSLSLLRWMAGEAMAPTANEDEWDALVPVINGFEEPLHALYHRRALPEIEAALAAGKRRANSFLPAVRTRYLSEAEVRRHDPELHSFFNANTPDEWAQALRLLAAP